MSESIQSLGWEDIFLCYPIFDNICAHLDPQDILFLQLATKKLSPSFESLFNTQWNINRQLTRFVNDPVNFRSKLAKHDALISGSFALQFFERRFWHDSDLDIYVDGSNELRSPDPIGEYLVEREGYKLRSTKTEEDSDSIVHGYANRIEHISQIKTYHRRCSGKKMPNQIQIIYTMNTPLQAIVAGFHHTLVMNFISWDFAYSLFPDLNFIKKTAYEINGDNINAESGDDHDPQTKYTRRGWNFEKAAVRGDTKNLHSLQLGGRRRIGDSYTWSIALGTNGVTPGQPTPVLQHSFFKVEELGGGEEPGSYIVHMQILKACILRYQYTTSIKNYDRFAFWASVQRKLDSLSHSQLLKYHWTERPLRFNRMEEVNLRYVDIANEIAGQEPEGWTFYDDQISTWYDHYLKDEAQRFKAEKEKGQRDQAELEHHIMNELKMLVFEQEEFVREQADLGLHLKEEGEGRES
ncbi:hypothetical protein DID88_010086 [Monilinia fructigena]|uniref:Uncharacterized protein n=1 Tax=Monilinia fructigena TaxID=38457 RepID=A0A395IL40_9HELO|nr:hypothetical protein DID88_010086 [Monilinia fructigena]